MDTHALGDVAHTGDNFNLYFRATQERWNIANKVEAIVTDNASNGVSFCDCVSIRCGGHTLQLAVNDCLADQKIQ